MSTELVLLIVAGGGAGGALFGLAWWRSGRARGAEYNPLAAGERGEAEARMMKQYRPPDFGPGV